MNIEPCPGASYLNQAVLYVFYNCFFSGEREFLLGFHGSGTRFDFRAAKHQLENPLLFIFVCCLFFYKYRYIYLQISVFMLIDRILCHRVTFHKWNQAAKIPFSLTAVNQNMITSFSEKAHGGAWWRMPLRSVCEVLKVYSAKWFIWVSSLPKNIHHIQAGQLVSVSKKSLFMQLLWLLSSFHPKCNWYPQWNVTISGCFLPSPRCTTTQHVICAPLHHKQKTHFDDYTNHKWSSNNTPEHTFSTLPMSITLWWLTNM